MAMAISRRNPSSHSQVRSLHLLMGQVQGSKLLPNLGYSPHNTHNLQEEVLPSVKFYLLLNRGSFPYPIEALSF
eukprot:c12667_g1_i1 orf=347-568(-)